MDAQTLREAMGNRPGVDYDALVGPCNEAMIVADVTTFLRAVLWCAQIGHESGGLQYMEEIADGSAYEGRRDLGNTQPGDGRRYKGRGPIQLTGRDNYRRFSQWAAGRGLVGSPTHFEDNPQAVSEPRWGFMAAAFFWSTNNINRFADGREVTNSTHVINGGENGLQDRINRYNQAFPLGDRLLPSQETGLMGAVADKVDVQLNGVDGQGWIDLLGRSVEVDPRRGRTVVEVLGIIFEQLVGEIEKGEDNPERGKSFGGWTQLGDGPDSAVPARTLVDGIAHVKNQNDQILELLRKLEAK